MATKLSIVVKCFTQTLRFNTNRKAFILKSITEDISFYKDTKIESSQNSCRDDNSLFQNKLFLRVKVNGKSLVSLIHVSGGKAISSFTH